jgi:hypothetical protein
MVLLLRRMSECISADSMFETIRYLVLLMDGGACWWDSTNPALPRSLLARSRLCKLGCYAQCHTKQFRLVATKRQHCSSSLVSVGGVPKLAKRQAHNRRGQIPMNVQFRDFGDAFSNKVSESIRSIHTHVNTQPSKGEDG